MSIVNFANRNTAPKELGNYYTVPFVNSVNLADITSSAFVRNPAWKALPAVSASENKIVALHAVYREANFCAFTITGSYVVDWGDGVVENFSASQQANHNYDYNSASLSGTDLPVTFQAAGDTVTLTTHSYVNGSTISFFNVQAGTFITSSQTYFVINPTTNTFQLATGSNGPAIDITSDISGSILEYKQAIITITPSGSFNFNTVNFQVKYTGADALAANLPAYSTGFLDMLISAPVASTFTFGGTTVLHRKIENLKFLSGNFSSLLSFCSNCFTLRKVDLSGISANISNMNTIFQNCTSLTDIIFPPNTSTNTGLQNSFDSCRSLVTFPLFNTSGVSSWAQCFTNCAKLVTIPLLDMRSCGDINRMFNGCSSLQSIPLLNTTSATNMELMFTSCGSLLSIPLLDTRNVTNMNQMFNECRSLKTVPLFDTRNVTNMNFMFQNCLALESVPLFDTRNVTNMGSMFLGCTNLISIPLFNTEKVTDFSSMFSTCSSLLSVPLLNTVSGSSMASMFTSCRSLKSVPEFNTIRVTSMASMFNGCLSLVTTPLFDTRAVTNMATMFGSCAALESVPLFNTAAVTNMASMFSGATSIISIPPFNTVSLNSISQMFRTGTNLQNIPFLNTANCTDINRMFEGCAALTIIPAFNTAKVTNFDSAFNSCANLNSIPALNMASGSNFSNAFNACVSISKNDSFGQRFTFSVGGHKMSSGSLETLFNNVGIGASQTLTISTNWGAPTAITSAATTTVGSTNVTGVTTSSLAVGMQVTGTNTALTTAVACTFQDVGDTVTEVGHGLSNGDEVSFATIVTTTGIVANTIYFVVNAAADTFQVAATSGGAALPLTTNGSGTLRYRTTIASIGAGTITLSRPATASGATTLSFRFLKTGTALLKGWAVSG
jgi:surface protein